MSIGYHGRMELFSEDKDSAIYRYGGENWNDESETRGSIDELDGEIIIYKKCLVEPKIHTRIKKTASHKKILVTKRVIQPFDLGESLNNGGIQIRKPCRSEYSHGLHLGIDQMYFAMQLLRKLFTEYQEQGKLPEKCSFVV